MLSDPSPSNVSGKGSLWLQQKQEENFQLYKPQYSDPKLHLQSLQSGFLYDL